MITVMIADDCVLFREGLRFLIEQDKNIKVVGFADDGQHAFELCNSLKPDIVLMDIKMPNYDGIQGLKLIKSKFKKSIKIIMLTVYEDVLNISNTLKNGADGFILKDIEPSELIVTIKNTINGLRIIEENVFHTLVKYFDTYNEIENQNKFMTIDSKTLNNNELAIIKFIVLGNSNKEISQKLNLSEGRVKNIISSILNKLSLNDRTQLAVFALKSNIFY